MKKILIVLAFMLGAADSYACSPDPSGSARLTNDIIAAVANQYGAFILTSDIQLENFQHQYQWKYTDSSYMCHDTDVISTDMTINFESPFGGQTCSVSVKVDQTTGPQVEGGSVETIRDVAVTKELSCQ